MNEDMYLGSGIYESNGIEHYEERVVACRKEHQCSSCENKIPQGDKAIKETGFYDGKPVSNYICLKCIKQWLKDSRQI